MDEPLFQCSVLIIGARTEQATDTAAALDVRDRGDPLERTAPFAPFEYKAIVRRGQAILAQCESTFVNCI
ncbi:hypothetical protein I5731_01955 [Methylobrevis sp. L22]|uniref:Uncharacterized protein n=1 Tax=Methylobrevis albus TaxID=2793297 RepID=A0A931MYC5_9HYPH|nr:hypothetical protein [Methylobrevis albus]